MSRRPAKFFSSLLRSSVTNTAIRHAFQMWEGIGVLCVLVGLLSLAGLASGQINPGTPSFSAFDAHAVDTIDLQNLNISLNMPIWQKSGAFPLEFNLSANSYITTSVNGISSQFEVCSLNQSCPLSGALVGQVHVGPPSFSSQACPDNPQTNTNVYTNWTVVSSDGTIHPVNAVGVDTKGCIYGTQFTAQTLDGSGYTLTVITTATNYSIQSLYGSAGGSYPLGSITDSNGNSITATTGSNAITYTDTLGVNPAFTAGFSSNPQSLVGPFTWTDVNSNSQQVSATYTSGLTLKSAFGCSSHLDYDNTGQSLPTSISFPDGTAMGISYEPTPGGSSGQYTGRLSQLTLRTRGTVTYNYNPSSAPNDGIDCNWGIPNKLTRVTSEGTTTYMWAAVNNGNGNYGNTTTVVDNGGNATVYTFTGLTQSFGTFPSPLRADLPPDFRTSPSMISDEGKGKGYVKEQAHGSADDRGAEAVGGGAEGGGRGAGSGGIKAHDLRLESEVWRDGCERGAGSEAVAG